MEEADKKAYAYLNKAAALDGLHGYVYRCLQEAYASRSLVTQRLTKAIYAEKRKYLPDYLPENDPDMHSGITFTKMRQAENWLRTVLTAAVGNLWTLSPTAVPEIPPEYNAEIYAQLQQEAEQVAHLSEDDFKRLRSQLEELAQKYVAATAKKKVSDLERLVKDILDDSNFESVLNDFIISLSRYPYAVLQAPYIAVKPKITFSQSSGEVSVQPSAQFGVRNVDPLTFYWSSGANHINDCRYCILDEVVHINDLLDMADASMPGMLVGNVEQVSKSYSVYDVSIIPVDESLKTLRAGETTQSPSDTGLLRCIKFYGLVPGKHLIGIDGAEELVTSTERYYDMEVWIVNSTPVKVLASTNPLGQRGFYTTSMYAAPFSVIGEGLADVLFDVERVCNAAMRNTAKALPCAALPYIEYDPNRLLDPTDAAGLEVIPGVPIAVQPNILSGENSSVFRFSSIPTNIAAIENVYSTYAAKADTISGIPPHVSGNIDVASMARTASGLATIMRAATQTLQNVVANIDNDIVSPLVADIYYWITLYHPDPKMKADAKVKAAGVAGVLSKEFGKQQLHELLNLLAPFAQANIVPPQLLTRLLRTIVSEMGYDADSMIPDDTSDRMMQWKNLMVRGGAPTSSDATSNSAAPPNLTSTTLPTTDGRFVQ